MKGQALEPMKQREERKRSSPPRSEDKKERVQWNGLGRDPQRLPKVRDPRDAQHN